MSASLLEFLAARLGHRVQSAGGLGGECVDLIEMWGESQGAAPIPGNAVDLFALAPPGEWEHIANAPTNAPIAGDIVIWHAAPAVGIGSYGHTAIAVHADSQWLVTADQNWPPGAPVGFVLHSYAGVRGWIRRLPPK